MITGGDTILKVVGLTKEFDDLKAVDDISFEIGEGEIVGLVGPNGCGKTTSINCITSIWNSTDGQIFIEGHDLYRAPEKAKRNIAYVPEMPMLLFSELTVMENIQFASKAYFHDDWKDTAERLVKEFDLVEKKNDAVRGLSKGQKQKTAIICAFVHEPKLVFFDEPLIGIDPKGGKVLKDIIREHRAKGNSALISSHMLGLIEEICDRVMIMNKGKIVMEGAFHEIEEQARKKLSVKATCESKEDRDIPEGEIREDEAPEKGEAGEKDYDFEELYIKITEGEESDDEAGPGDSG